MSNLEASKLYETIVEDVISDSRQDFENMGVDEQTLLELRKIWCEKLTQSKVCKFSWDFNNDDEQEDDDQPLQQQQQEQHQQQQQQPQPQSQSQSQQEKEQQSIQAQTSNSSTNPEIITNETQVKVEEDSFNGKSDFDPLSYNNNLGLELPTVTNNLNSKPNNGNDLVLPKLNQNDGTFEMTIHVNNPKKFMNKLQRSQRNKLSKKPKKKFYQIDGTLDDSENDDDLDEVDLDEEDRDIFNDSDDINSDLDDDLESDKSDDDEENQEGQIMLCLYDKVQRIKNKWKSNLKEGIANIDGKDYVFHKATGECEW
ncbi:TOA1 [Candida pseudojiufengensis]|uniref:TOA1 n=1 Tax=Candida pseudojiufengensis TaxID=497109 RepID=UPI002224A284|nr:TOA1 [Candida pseudojiufengensis]KAI5965668.1 TOA1 [Candida pseudojiufengensis]